MVLLILSGLFALYIGAEWLVRYSVHLANILGISPLIIGLTVVAYGTSSPELVVNVIASLSGNNEIALGNIVGSNIFNIFFILGLSALITPLFVHKQVIRFDLPIMAVVSIIMWIAASFGKISFWTGILFLILIIAYTIFLIFQSKKEENQNEFKQEFILRDQNNKSLILKDVCWIVLSLIVLVIGSKLLVNGSVELAKFLGVSELVISLTIIAAGTSFPEVATSVVAAMRGQRDIAVGNIVGSNIYNILAILGLSAVLAKDGIAIPKIALSFDIPVMVAAAIVCLPVFFTGQIIYRWEGAVLLAYYVAYLAHVILEATSHSWLGPFQDAMLFFFIPLTLMALALSVLHHFRMNK